MATLNYVAVLERGLNGSFGVFFPDLPGCVSAGLSADEAMTEAREALALHVEGMIEDGAVLPKPSSVHAFGADDFEGSDVAALFFVPVEVPSGLKADDPPMRINVSLPESLIGRIDTAADASGLTRSGLLAVAARQFLTDGLTRRSRVREAAAGVHDRSALARAARGKD
ncbi:type II toxin-antitoxin system HicB family antitoxin [Brevundimonas sp.]|uniref:type II toxin-antitoxin system HicB family antitoxin n=1 Tax=Brevundimonas sp. TaxID=1871086 RepID=UPI0035B27E54